jgi:hypothetical protein
MGLFSTAEGTFELRNIVDERPRKYSAVNWELFTAPLDLCRWKMCDEKVWCELPIAEYTFLIVIFHAKTVLPALARPWRMDFSKKPSAPLSLLNNDDLSNELNFGRIHPAGQYL